MSKLHQLHDRYGQSPWLDNLTRAYLRDGTLGRLVADGIRGVTANPTIFAKAIDGSDAYDEQFGARIAQGRPVLDAYWDLVVDDIRDALAVLRPTFNVSDGTDGFVSVEVAPELARRLDAVGTGEALALRGRAAVAQAKLAYRQYQDQFGGPRWEALAAKGAQAQRPLWASTSTKNPAYPDTLHVDSLIGPDTVNTLPEPTIAAFEDHGTLARTIDSGVGDAEAVMHAPAEVGVDMDDVGGTLEDQGVASFHQSFAHVLQALQTKARQLARR